MKNFDILLKITFFSFGLFPILPKKLKGLPVVLLIITSIYYVAIKGVKKFNIRIFIILSSLFIINMLSLLNSFNFPINKIETMLSLLLVPLSFSFISKKLNSKYKKYFILTFIFSSITLSAIHLTYYLLIGLFDEGSLKVNSFRKAVVEIPIFKDHPTYISIFLAISILLIPLVCKITKSKVRLCFVIGVMFCLINLCLISSKGVIISLFISLIIFTLLKNYRKRIRLLIVCCLVLGFVISVLHFPTIEKRFVELTKRTTYTNVQPNNSTSIRIGIYACVIKAITEKPIFGYGLGSFPQKKFYIEASSHLSKMNYNSHNQYLGFFLNAGIFGFLVLVFFLLYSMKRAINYKDYIFFTTVLFFSIVMLTENILERQSGVILFAFLICFFNFIGVEKNITFVKNRN